MESGDLNLLCKVQAAGVGGYLPVGAAESSMLERLSCGVRQYVWWSGRSYMLTEAGRDALY